MNHNITLETENLIIKPMSPKDSEKYRLLRNRDENRFCFLNTDLISGKQQSEWYNKYLSGPDYMFSVYCKYPSDMDSIANAASPGSLFIGGAGIYHIDTERKSAEFGRIIIDRSKAGKKGYGCEALLALCRISKSILGLSSLYLEVLSSNAPAVKTYIKAGFTYKDKPGDSDILFMEKPL